MNQLSNATSSTSLPVNQDPYIPLFDFSIFLSAIHYNSWIDGSWWTTNRRRSLKEEWTRCNHSMRPKAPGEVWQATRLFASIKYSCSLAQTCACTLIRDPLPKISLLVLNYFHLPSSPSLTVPPFPLLLIKTHLSRLQWWEGSRLSR